MRLLAFPSLLFMKIAEMGQVTANIRKLVSDIIARLCKGGNKEKNTGGQIPPSQVEEIREQLLTIAEDAYVITIGREDEGQERSADEIVEEKQQVNEIPPSQVEEIRERLLMIAEDAYVITIGREDEGQERSVDEIVQEKQQLNEIPPGQVEEIRERLVPIAEDAYVLIIGREDQDQGRSADEFVEEKQQLNEIIACANRIVPIHEQFHLGGTSETLQYVNDVDAHKETSGKTPISDTSTCVGVVLQTPSPLLKETYRWIKHYCSSHKILLVGEGDFSFSACLAKAFGSAANMVATSLNSQGFLQENYKKAMSNINYLKNRGCTVRHNFDATAMYNNRRLLNYGSGFDRIIYNFPLAGFFPELSLEHKLSRNRHLVRTFMENARKMLQPDGEIHITHKSNGFFLAWDLEDLATKSGLRLLAYVEFNLKDYPGYHTKYGFGGDKDFDCKPSLTYKFGLQ